MSDKAQEIEALLEERRGYVMVGDTDRVAAVDAELARLGYESPAPKGRTARKPSQATAD